MLKKVKYQNWRAPNFAYAPPTEDAVIQTDRIVSVTPTESRGSGPFVLVKFDDGTSMTCIGKPEDFLE